MKIAEIPVEGYERVVEATDDARGFHAFIAVHDTTLGPALGGMRVWNYDSAAAAREDVLRLARGMTYKSAVARTGLGGGKSVVLADPLTGKSDELFLFMGAVVDSLGGKYITAEDVGTSTYDLDVVAQQTRWVTGRSREVGGSGDPSPFTALGTFRSIEVSLDRDTSGDLAGCAVAIQGLGHVGYWLAHHLHRAGAELYVSDLHAARVERARDEFGARIVPQDEIFDAPCDVFAPCALGAILDDETIPRLRCKVVCGAANNQLAEPRHADALASRGILYAPDYVVNAGGVLNISVELEPRGYDEARAIEKVENIPHALREIYARARAEGITTAEASDRLAERILDEARSAGRAAGERA